MRKSTLKVWVLVAILAVVYVAAVLSTWIVQTRAAVERLDWLVESGVTAAFDNVDWTVEPEVLRIARILVARFGDFETAANADLESVRTFLDCGQISVVDTNNVVVASTDPDCVGMDMTSSPETDAFTALNGGKAEYVSQQFRRSRNSRGLKGGDDGAWFKYVGMPFPGGGYIQVGDTYRDFQRRFVGELACLFQRWYVGENGYILLVDRERGTILSGFREEWSGIPLADSGLDPKAFDGNADETVRTFTAFGDIAYVRRVCFAFVDMDAYVVIPKDDVMFARDSAVKAVSLLVGLVFLLGGLLFCKVIRQHERIEDLFLREAMRIDADMAMAKSIQENALPSVFPPYPKLAKRIDIFARMVAAKKVGGDFYDIFRTESGKLVLVVADVSGKGVPAALFMMRSMATIRGALRGGLDIVEAIAVANHRLSKSNDANMFVTAWIGILDLATGEMEYVNAGHNPPLVLRADGTVAYLSCVSDLPLAAMDGTQYRRQTLKLETGDGVVLYTDGVTEAMDDALTLYGEERLVGTVRQLVASSGVAELIKGVMDDIERFADGVEQADDITILAVRLIG